MNVVFVYRYLTLGGVEVVLNSRLVGLPALGIQPTLWFLSDGPGRNLWRPDQVGVFVGSLSGLRKHLEATPADSLSIIDTPEALEVAASLQPRPRVLLEVHTPYPENRAYLRSPECRIADAVLVPSEFQRQVVEREMPRGPRIIVVPNPVGLAFETSPVSFDSGGSGPIVAWVGRLDRLKNWRGFLSVASRVIAQVPQAEVWVIGSGTSEEEAEFQRSCRCPRVRARLRWLRGVPPSAMPRMFDAVRSSGGVVVSTSRGESFGMAIAEAMARGCAVVVPRLGPFPALASEAQEWALYPAGDYRAAAALIRFLLVDHGARQRSGFHARDAVLRAHSWQVALPVLAKVMRREVEDK